MKWFFYLVLAMVLVSSIPITSAYDVSFPWGGTYYFTCSDYPACPSNITYVYLNMAGAGGSGKSSGWSGIAHQYGNGGEAGEFGNITMVPFGYTTNYTIVVGEGGAESPIEGFSYAGGDTTAIGYIKHGGIGGTQGGAIAHVGGAGESTYYLLAAPPASSGGSVTGYAGGVGGTGYGSGGGGAASNASTTRGVGTGIGGAGMDGYVRLFDMNGSATNTPAYTATPTSVGYGNVVTFTDESILGDLNNLVYLWDFGDGSTSSNRGTTTHVYSTYGVFTTNLTLTSDSGTAYLNKSNYITVTNTPITAWYQQRIVKFKIVDAYGADLSGANVSATYLTNTLPSKDSAYLVSAFGISQAVATQMVNGDTAMYGLTGTNGETSFMLFPAIQYGITITNESAGLSKYVEIYPTDTEYIIRCPLTSQAMPTMASTSLANASLYVTESDPSWITWNLIYSDPSGHTTGLTWNVTCWNNMTVMHNNSWGAIGASDIIVDNYTFPSVPAGMEYVARYRAVRDIP